MGNAFVANFAVMNINMPHIRSASSEHIKHVALRLFAEQGVDGVTVRDIAKAAGQKNHGAVGYHFGSKEALVREIIIDGARIIDDRRQRALDALEAAGGPRSVREVVEVMIYPSIALHGEDEDDFYLRFTVVLNMTHRELFLSAIGNQWNRGYQRCLSHLRRLMPAMPAAIKNQRMVFVGGYVAMVLALRQTALSDTTRIHSTWPSPETLRHIALTASAIIEAPHDEDYLAAPSPQI
jgi:AcrR family transcriptional regulator